MSGDALFRVNGCDVRYTFAEKVPCHVDVVSVGVGAGVVVGYWGLKLIHYLSRCLAPPSRDVPSVVLVPFYTCFDHRRLPSRV